MVVGGRYRLTRLIGSGGMGRVWLARDEVLHRQVAVKEVVLPPELSGGEIDELRQRMLREGRAAGRLSHPNVVAIYDVVQEGERPWIVMEYVPSRSLYQVVKQDGPVAPRRAAEIGLAILRALRAAHGAGVLHRDVKPGNVLLAEDGRVVLTDFGLATFDGDGAITRAGLIMGSAQYISPERARDGASSPESDLWSLGATLYAAVEGRSPYARDSSMATLTALATAPPDPARRAGPLQVVLDGLLQKHPRHRMRPAEAEALLRRIADGEYPRAGMRRAGKPQRQRVNEPVDPPEVDPSSTGGAPSPVRLRTATEETLNYRPPQRLWGRWFVAAAGVVVLVTAAAVAATMPWQGDGRDAGANAPPTGEAQPTGAALSAAMRVQACLDQSGSAESPVSPGPTAVPGGYAVINPNFTYHVDGAGFHLQVPRDWMTSRLGPLLCFRDPSSPKALAVHVDGRIDGEPMSLLAATEDTWRAAAGLAEYERISLEETYIGDGSADLEYTYARGGQTMHGENRMLRLSDQVFTIFWLTTDLYWTTDRGLLDIIQPSFGLRE
jgi:hypothetical protein